MLQRKWPSLDQSRFPLVRISSTGTAVSAGELITLAARQSVWMPVGTISHGLPNALADVRPSGFLGRHFAASCPDLRLPLRVSDWSDHHILTALSRRGEDLPGDLIVGEESFARWQALEDVAATRDDYPALAEATIAGRPPASLAGGERPKFGALSDGRHVLVKFATRGAAPDIVARRWCDLLILEGLALGVIGAHGIDAARTHVFDTSSHWFLESERFDRVGARGRRAVLSLAALHDDPAHSWTRAAILLREAGRLSAEDARRLRWLDTFGALIGNNDRHQYNVLFFTDDGRTTQLAPAFDQVSMLYAPTADGRVPPRTFAMPPALPENLDVWPDAREAAQQLWTMGSEDARVSDDVRTICADNARLFRESRA